jgi:hypothetical protein
MAITADSEPGMRDGQPRLLGRAEGAQGPSRAANERFQAGLQQRHHCRSGCVVDSSTPFASRGAGRGDVLLLY